MRSVASLIPLRRVGCPKLSLVSECAMWVCALSGIIAVPLVGVRVYPELPLFLDIVHLVTSE